MTDRREEGKKKRGDGWSRTKKVRGGVFYNGRRIKIGCESEDGCWLFPGDSERATPYNAVETTQHQEVRILQQQQSELERELQQLRERPAYLDTIRRFNVVC